MASDFEADGAELHTTDAIAKAVKAKMKPPSVLRGWRVIRPRRVAPTAIRAPSSASRVRSSELATRPSTRFALPNAGRKSLEISSGIAAIAQATAIHCSSERSREFFMCRHASSTASVTGHRHAIRVPTRSRGAR